MVYIVISIVCAILGYVIGESKGRGGLGAVLGLFFSIVGVIIIAVMGESPERIAARTAAGPNAVAGSIPAAPMDERLAKLRGLHESGALTEAEYQSQRARVLREI